MIRAAVALALALTRAAAALEMRPRPLLTALVLGAVAMTRVKGLAKNASGGYQI